MVGVPGVCSVSHWGAARWAEGIDVLGCGVGNDSDEVGGLRNVGWRGVRGIPGSMISNL